MQELLPSSISSQLPQASLIPEPLVINQYQDFSDLPSMQVRKGIDDDGNPWTPDILLVDGGSVDPANPSAWAQRHFSGASFQKDFSMQPGILARFPIGGPAPFWVIRVENMKPRRKLLTVRLYVAPAGYEDESLAWTPVDKFLFEIEARQQAAVARRADLGHLFETWSRRQYFQGLGLPMNAMEAKDNPAWIFVSVLLTDAEIDHPENGCHCGSVQACNATAEGLDRRAPRYPFDRVFKHSIRTTFPLLGPTAMRILHLGGE